MGKPVDDLELIRRSLFNLQVIERQAGPSGPYEVTQLINTLMLVLVIPKERWYYQIPQAPIVDESPFGLIRVTKGASDLRTVLTRIRNSLCHDNMELRGDDKQIWALRFGDNPKNATKFEFVAEISVDDLRQIVPALLALWERVKPQG